MRGKLVLFATILTLEGVILEVIFEGTGEGIEDIDRWLEKYVAHTSILSK